MATNLFSLTKASDAASTSSKRLPPSMNKLPAIAKKGSHFTRYIGPRRPQHEMQFEAEDPSIIYKGRKCALTAAAESGYPACRPFAPLTAANALRLRSAFVAIFGDMAFELGAKAFVALTDGDLGRDPKGSAQAGIADIAIGDVCAADADP